MVHLSFYEKVVIIFFMNKTGKVIIRNIIILLVLPFAGLLLMLLVQLLPTGKMFTNVLNSKDTIVKEFDYGLVVDGYPATLTGGFTDSLMLEFAIYNTPHSAAQQVMNMYRAESCTDGGWRAGESLVDYLDGSPNQHEVTYARYWHGYLVILKPLLLLASFNTIRMINGAFQLLLLCLVIVLYTKKGYGNIAVSLGIAMPFLMFTSSFTSLSLSICLYLALLQLLILPMIKPTENSGVLTTFFLVSGALTAYFDFLTYPLITLGFPLVAYLCMTKEKNAKQFGQIGLSGVCWGIGYAFMWASKWLLAAIFAGGDVLSDATSTIAQRTSAMDSRGRLAGYLDIVKDNLSPYANRAFLLFMAAAVIGLIIFIAGKGLKEYLKTLKTALPVICLAILPFLWWFVTSNHSGEHWQFTCRIFAITIFAVFGGLTKGFNERTE